MSANAARARCTKTHPLTGQRCTRDEGHAEGHDAEEFTEAEKRRIAAEMADDTKALMEKWIDRRVPTEAMSGSAMAMFLTIEQHIMERSEADIIRAFFGCLSNSDSCMEDHDIFLYCAKQLGVPHTLLRMGKPPASC